MLRKVVLELDVVQAHGSFRKSQVRKSHIFDVEGIKGGNGKEVCVDINPSILSKA